MASSNDGRSVASPLYDGHDDNDDVHERGSDEADPALGPLERLQRKWGIGDRKTRAADGAPAKRRGPKPDSKPAMTRRQELNRQAQRTHRERKENYMRELEIAVDKLKKQYEEDVVRVREENKKLRALLTAHNIQHDFNGSQPSLSPTSAIAAPSVGSVYGSHSGFTSPTHTNMPNMSMASSPSYQQLSYPTSGSLPVPRSNIQGLDYEDVAIDFVGQYGRTPYLSPPPNQLEQSCRQHQQYMVNRSVNDEDWVCGHALMATVPPRQHCIDHGMDVEYPHRMPELPKPDLIRMLNLSTQLPGLRDELTPVMAWAFLFNHEAFPAMTPADIDKIRDELVPKVNCYGFGAVLEHWEVTDALDRALTTMRARSPQSAVEMEWESLSPSAR